MRTGLLLLVIPAVLLSGCAAAVNGQGSAVAVRHFPSSASQPSSGAPPAPSGATPVLQAPAAGDWTPNVDPASGIAFDLPAQPAGSTEQGATPNGVPFQVRLYTVEIGGPKGLGVSVGILTGTSARVRIDLASYPTMLVEQFKAAGATDARASELQQVTTHGHPAIDFRFTFTGIEAPHPVAEWLVRFMDDGDHYIIEQTIYASTQPARVLPVVRAVQARLEAGVRPV